MMELAKSVTFHDFCEARDRHGTIKEDMRDLASSDASSSSAPSPSIQQPKKTKSRKGLPLNASFSSWLQIFLKKRRSGVNERHYQSQFSSIRPSVSLCKREGRVNKRQVSRGMPFLDGAHQEQGYKSVISSFQRIPREIL